MRRFFFELTTLGLFGGGFLFFREALGHLARRDYVGSGIVALIGVAIFVVGRDMARLALVQKD